MRTIKHSFINKLAAQASEAEVRGLSNVAEVVTEQVVKHADFVRKNDAFYIYSDDSFRKDVNSALWDAVIRVADYYDLRQFNVDDVNSIVERTAGEMIKEICTSAGTTSSIGAYETAVPGEVKSFEIEVEE